MTHNSLDHGISQQVTNRLASRGLNAPCRVVVQANGGEVTLTGTVQYPHQKLTAVKAANGIAGVRRVVDRLTVKPLGK